MAARAATREEEAVRMGMEKGWIDAAEAGAVAAVAEEEKEGEVERVLSSGVFTSPPPPLLLPLAEEEEEEDVVVGVEKAATIVRVRPTPPPSTISFPTEGSDAAR